MYLNRNKQKKKKDVLGREEYNKIKKTQAHLADHQNFIQNI